MNRSASRRDNILFYCLLFIAALAQWMLLKSGFDISYTNFAGTAVKAVGDVALMLAPCWLLSPKWRWTAVAALWAASIWFVANLAYFRFWGDLIPPAAITMGGNVDGNLMEYGASLLRWTDICFLIIPVLATVAYRLLRVRQSPALAWRCRFLLFAASLVVGLAGQAAYLKTTFAWNNAVSPRTLAVEFRDHFFGGYTGQKRLYTYNGPAYYGVRYLFDTVGLLTSSVDLDQSQRSDIDAFIGRYRRQGNPDDQAALDSINVVYIIVESLNAEMLGSRIGGMSVMPVLDSLARIGDTVLFDNVVSQIKASSSSDGHLLLLTGLLPPDKVAYSISYGSVNKFPSLADVMPCHHKYLLLADEGVCWNEGNTLRNFGLGDPLVVGDRSDRYDPAILGRDGAMFRQAADIVKTARQPFFTTLMTISMHIPFKEEGWEMPQGVADAPGLSRMEKDYASVCHHADFYIGEFLRSLPTNTLVFIASDHSQGVASFDDSTLPAVFMALNTHLTATAPQTGRISRTVGQVNLFPAALDILGRDAGYAGLAPSAFNPSVVGSRDAYGNIYGEASKATLDTLDAAFQVSDLIIRGDYFNQ